MYPIKQIPSFCPSFLKKTQNELTLRREKEKLLKERSIEEKTEDLVGPDLTVLYYRVSRVRAVWHWWEAYLAYRAQKVNPVNRVTDSKWASRETRAHQVDFYEPFLCTIPERYGWRSISCLTVATITFFCVSFLTQSLKSKTLCPPLADTIGISPLP